MNKLKETLQLCLFFLPVDEGLWDILIKDIPKEATSYTLNLEMLREGVTYDFRVIAVNDYGYGSPSAPSPSISGTWSEKQSRSDFTKQHVLILLYVCHMSHI